MKSGQYLCMLSKVNEVVYGQGAGVGFAFANRLANCSMAKVLVGPDSPPILLNGRFSKL